MERKRTWDEGPPIPIAGVVYRRYNALLNRSIYIREGPGFRPYPDPEIKKLDKTFWVGIYDWNTKQALDIMYSFPDQHAMFEKVIDNLVQIRERAKHIGGMAKKLLEQSELGLIKSPWSEGPRTKGNLMNIRKMLKDLETILKEYEI